MKLFLSLLLVLLQVFTPFAYSGTKTLVKADILEGNVAEIDILGSTGHFEKNAFNWSAYDDAAADPVDATGGTSTTTCARTATTPIDGDGSLLMTKTGGASYQGEGCALTFTVPANLSGEPLQVSFEYKVDSGTYADDAVELWLYNSTGAALIQPAPTLLKNHLLNRQTYRAEFQPTYSTSAQTFRLALHIGGSDTTAYALKLDNFRVYKGKKSYGSPATDWVSYTPTGSWTANSPVYTGQWRRVGDSMELIAKVVCGGAATAANLTINIPTGHTIDAVKINASQPIGTAYIEDSGVLGYEGFVKYSTTTAIAVTATNASSTYSSATAVTQAVPLTFGASDFVIVSAKVPIAGWGSSVLMSNDADTRPVVATMFRTSSNQTISSASETLVQLNGSSPDSHGGGDVAAFRYNVKVPGFYEVSASVRVSSFTANEALTVRLKQSGTTVSNITADGSNAGTASNIVVPPRIISATAGQYFELYVQSTADSAYDIAGTADTFTYMTVKRVSGPAQIAASDTVGALYTGAPPTGTLAGAYNTTTFGTKVKDSHGAYSGGTYTVPVSGIYDISASAFHTATYILGSISKTAVFIDGVEKYTGVIATGGAQVYTAPPVSVESVPLLAGQLVTIRSFDNGTTPTFVTDAAVNFFSIVKVGNY